MRKKGNDFATEVDLAIERQVVEALTRQTGIEVHGEEFGGADIDSPLVWVLDPIDGTFNYAAGSPMAAILLGLLRDGEPVAGLTWLPFTGQRYTARRREALCAQRRRAAAAAARAKLADSIVGIGTFNVDSRGRFPGRYRLAALENLSRKCSRVRMHGATGIDLAYTAAGILGGAISFGAPRLGPRRRRRAGAGGGRHRHRPGRQRLDHDVALGAGRGARRARRDPRARERSVGDPEDY